MWPNERPCTTPAVILATSRNGGFLTNFDNIEQEIHELPLPAEDVERADYVLLSHDDGDHLDPESIKRIAHRQPTVIAPASL